ncbi:MAG TPA: response regulator transcription factor, partial [Solirubrobacteraceae bacterium]|nr:response regulator transcription factor [Solirubrobacteraceae bacterium]
MSIRAQDVITRAGLVAQLAHRPEVHVVDGDATVPGGVTVVLADELDGSTSRAVRAARVGDENRVVLVVTRLAEGDLLEAVEAGASSVLRRSEATPDRVIDAVQVASSGAAAMSPDLLGELLDHVGRLQRDVLAPRGLRFSGLTEREVRVLKLIAEGLDTTEIGHRLFYSERTVKNIIHDITSRLNLRNRSSSRSGLDLRPHRLGGSQ